MGKSFKGWSRSILQYFQSTRSSSKPIWSGIYSSFDQVPLVGGGFEGRRFAEETRSYTRLLLEGAQRQKTIPTQTTCQHGLLPLLASLVAEKSGEVRILDFGGGTGAAFVHVLSSLPEWVKIKFDVVETASACELGRELFADDPRVSFHTELPDRLTSIDIVHISSALQYVSDYRKTLIDLCGFQAAYFLLANLAAAAIPTYATAQNVYDDMVVPYWFLSVDEVIDILAAESYLLLWKSSLERTYDQSEFPPEYRMGQACNLLFHRRA